LFFLKLINKVFFQFFSKSHKKKEKMETIELVRSYIETLPKSLFQNSSLNEITSLSGGCCNYVYRLHFANNFTCILKYYPLNPPNADKSFVVSQDRYAVEKTSLLLLEKRPWLQNAQQSSLIHVPRVYHYDDTKFALIMEDAGVNSKTLLKLLAKESDGLYDETFLAKIAHDIHVFSRYISLESKVTPTSHPVFVANKAWTQVIGVLKYVWAQQAKKFDVEKAVEPYLTRANELFEAVDEKDKVWVAGDFWPNSILIDLEKRAVFVIDWEMARFENKLSDLGKLMDILWLMRQNEKVFNGEKVEAFMGMLQAEFFGNAKADWREHGDRNTKGEFLLWVMTLVESDMWASEKPRETVLKAIEQVENSKK
jgi:5-methylthioribose kinase